MTSPTPSLDSMVRLVEDLRRRVRDLETGAGARPGATSINPAPFPYSTGDTSRWAGFSSLDYRTFWVWWARMEWTSLDVAIRGTTTGDRAGQWRLTCDGAVLFEAPAQPGGSTDVLVETVVNLAELVDDAPSLRGGMSRFTIDGRVVGGSAGGFFTVPERLQLTGAR